MSFLISRVFGDEVEVLAADDEGSMHFGGDDGAGEDTAADRDRTCEGAFLVCRFSVRLLLFSQSTLVYVQWARTDVRALDRGLRGPEP